MHVDVLGVVPRTWEQVVNITEAAPKPVQLESSEAFLLLCFITCQSQEWVILNGRQGEKLSQLLSDRTEAPGQMSDSSPCYFHSHTRTT